MASDYLLVIDGIKGESPDAKIKDAIELQTFSFGVENGGSHSGGGGGGAGKASFADMECVCEVNSASSKLMLACATGEHIKKAVLHVRKQGKSEQQPYLVVTLSDLLISSYSNSGGGDPVIPVDTFNINFSKIEFEYKKQKDDGSMDAAIKTGYDIKANKKV